MDSYDEPFSYLRNYSQRSIRLSIIRDENEKIKLIIGRKNASLLENLTATGIILRETLQNPRYDESKNGMIAE